MRRMFMRPLTSVSKRSGLISLRFSVAACAISLVLAIYGVILLRQYDAQEAAMGVIIHPSIATVLFWITPVGPTWQLRVGSVLCIVLLLTSLISGIIGRRTKSGIAGLCISFFGLCLTAVLTYFEMAALALSGIDP